MSRYYFINPFAVSGDVAVIPQTDPGDGSINFADGFGANYALDPLLGPPALLIPRDKTNELFFWTTEAIKDLQEWYVPEFITSADNGGSAYSYDLKMRVKLAGEVYESNINANTNTPPHATWTIVPSAGSATIPESSAGGTANAVTATFSPALTTLAQDILVAVRSAAINTTAMTFDPDGLGPKSIYKGNNQAIAAGDIPGAAYWMLLQRDQTLDKWNLLNPYVTGATVPSASTVLEGITFLATNIECQAGVDALKTVTPAGLASVTATQTRAGLAEIATNAECQTGTDPDRIVTPAGLFSVSATTTRTGLAALATQVEVDAGVVTNKIVTPATLAGAAVVKTFVSTATALNASGTGQTITKAHGLGSEPNFVDLWAKATTSQGNWAIGEEICLGNGSQANSEGVTFSRTATNIIAVIGTTSFRAINKTSQVSFALNDGDWDLYIVARL